jgi:hypothetical protein
MQLALQGEHVLLQWRRWKYGILFRLKVVLLRIMLGQFIININETGD